MGLAADEHEALALVVHYAQREAVGLGGVHVEGVGAVLESVVGVALTCPSKAFYPLVLVPLHRQGLPLELALVGSSDGKVGVVGHLLKARRLPPALVEVHRPAQVLEVLRRVDHLVGDHPGHVQALPLSEFAGGQRLGGAPANSLSGGGGVQNFGGSGQRLGSA